MLSELHEAFAQVLAKTNSPGLAYHRVYNQAGTMTIKTCQSSGAKLARQLKVKDRVAEIIEEGRVSLRNVVGLDSTKLLRLFYEMAMADPNELIGLRVGCCRYCYGDDNARQWKLHEYLDAMTAWENLPVDVRKLQPMPDPAGGLDFDHTLEPLEDCPNCRGEGIERVVARDTTQLSDGAKLLYGGVKSKRDGIELVMHDRAKMLELVGRILGAFKDNATVNVRGTIAAAVASIPTDPQAASRWYQEMLEATGTG